MYSESLCTWLFWVFWYFSYTVFKWFRNEKNIIPSLQFTSTYFHVSVIILLSQVLNLYRSYKLYNCKIWLKQKLPTKFCTEFSCKSWNENEQDSTNKGLCEVLLPEKFKLKFARNIFIQHMIPCGFSMPCMMQRHILELHMRGMFWREITEITGSYKSTVNLRYLLHVPL